MKAIVLCLALLFGGVSSLWAGNGDKCGYCCPKCNHCDAKAGKCPKDGTEMAADGTYCCKHCGTSDKKAAKCSKCGKNMEKMQCNASTESGKTGSNQSQKSK